MTIALDVMGGDSAPMSTLEGALRAARDGISVVLCGPEWYVREKLHGLDARWSTLPIIIRHAPDLIAMAEEPVSAVRSKPHSSLVHACRLAAEGTVTGVVSAGNSGAFMVAAMFLLGREEGVERPAIAALLPSKNATRVVGLDLGANTECRVCHLEQFAHLGARYAQEMAGISRPRVAVLSNGHEEGKGSRLTKEVLATLKQSKLNVVGNIEPEGVLTGKD